MMRQIGPYGVIAGSCALLNVAILIAGDGLGVSLPLSTAVSFMSCVIVGYALHSRFTFGRTPTAASFFRYASAMALNYPLSLFAVWSFRDLLGMPMMIAAPASTIALVAYNFLSSRWAIGPAGNSR